MEDGENTLCLQYQCTQTFSFQAICDCNGAALVLYSQGLSKTKALQKVQILLMVLC